MRPTTQGANGVSRTRYGALSVLTAFHAVLWFLANNWEGVWRQVPSIDQSHDLTTAWLFLHALRRLDLHGVVNAWMHGSPVHTPLVPFASGLLMWVFGESRIVAESVLPVCTAIWLFATYAVLKDLVHERAAFWATVLASTFPVFLIYSRTYLFEHPLAAVFSVSCLLLLRTHRFDRRGWSVAFGVMAGLTALTRGMGFVILAGPVAVVIASLWRLPARGRRLRNCAMAIGVAAIVAATWYVPNAPALSEYLFRKSYGAEAQGGGLAPTFSVEHVIYVLTWLVASGPGIPLACISAAAWLVRDSPSAIVTRHMARALAIVFLIDFVVLLVAGQRVGARYFQPLMPLVGLLTVVGIARLRPRWARRTVAIVAALLSLHHVVETSATYRPFSPQRAVPYVRGWPLWDHTPEFSSLVSYYRLKTPADDFRLPETIALLEHERLAPDAIIVVIGPLHAFYQANGLRLQAVRTGHDWAFQWSPELVPSDLGGQLARIPVDDAAAVIVRSGGPTDIETTSVLDALQPLLQRPSGRFEPAAEMTLGDDSIVHVFVRRGS